MIMGRKRIKPVYEVIPGYTKRQSQFLRGEITLDEVDGRFYKGLLKHAVAINDTERIVVAKELLADAKKEVEERNRERARIRGQNIHNGLEIVYRQPKSLEYTERQKMIIRNEIPTEKVHANELIHIMQKAKAVGDIELADLVWNIIKERREESIEKSQQSFNLLLERKQKDTAFNEKNLHLTKWEINVLQSKVDDRECSIEHLYHIRDVAKLNNDEENLKLAELFIQYRLHPETVYRTQNKDEAMNNIERIIGLPIRRPKDWFPELTPAE